MLEFLLRMSKIMQTCEDSPSFSAFGHGPVFDDKVKTVMIIPSLSLMFTSSLSFTWFESKHPQSNDDAVAWLNRYFTQFMHEGNSGLDLWIDENS